MDGEAATMLTCIDVLIAGVTRIRGEGTTEISWLVLLC